MTNRSRRPTAKETQRVNTAADRERKRASGGRLIAVGDIHGYSEALRGLLEAIDPKPDDTIVTLGDYVDRGPDSAGVIDLLIDLAKTCRLVPILGNHDQMFLDVIEVDSPDMYRDWLSYGGTATLRSMGIDHPEDTPRRYRLFLNRCVDYYETESHFFIHANYLHDQPLKRLSVWVMRWESLRQRVPGPHFSGKTAVVGHTAQKNGRVLDLGYLKCIDTYLYGGGRLTALDVDRNHLWQTDAAGTVVYSGALNGEVAARKTAEADAASPSPESETQDVTAENDDTTA
ncbi:MAG: serine/threonine protein phosphatase [Planctomycetota bacterium]|nr:MAG: serine/threonine protein phosphatase [Planctomycetota bacterium]